MPVTYHLVEPEAPHWRRYPVASPRRDRHLAGAGTYVRQSGIEVQLSQPNAGPPPSIRVRVAREDSKFFGGSCDTRVYVVDADSRRVVTSIRPPFVRRTWSSAFRFDCLAEFTLTLPQGFDARRRVFLVFRNPDGSELARGQSFSLPEVAAQGRDSEVITDDRTGSERISDLGRGAVDLGNKLIWAGGIAASIVLISITRR